MVYTAFFLGLVSSLHCIGMCGPIAMMLPVDHNNPEKKALQVMTYHLGRLSAYAIIGFLFGLLGRGFFLAGIQQELSVVLGILMIFVIVVPEKLFLSYSISKPVYLLIVKAKSALGSQFKKKSFSSLFAIGLLNGFLPCGLVYVALFGAMAMQQVALGTVFMVLFGLGTVPLMSSVVYAHSFFSLPVRNKVRKVIPFVGIVIGVLFIFRGLGLGIPFVSPSNISLFIQEQPGCH